MYVRMCADSHTRTNPLERKWLQTSSLQLEPAPPSLSSALVAIERTVMTQSSNANNSQRVTAWKAGLLAVGAIVIGILAVTFWPTLYRYDHVTLSGNIFPVRTHRFSGKTEMLYLGTGWVEISNNSSPSRKPTLLPSDQLAKLDGRLAVTTYGYIKADIYNGTERELDTVKVEVTILDSSGAQVLRRVYKLTSTGGRALSSSEFIADCGFTLAPGQTYQWRIVSAKWE